MNKTTSDNIALFSKEHYRHPDYCTRIQIGHYRFKMLEKLVDFFYLRFNKPKFTSSNVEKL